MSVTVEQFPLSKPLSTKKKLNVKKPTKQKIPQTNQPFHLQIISCPRRKAFPESKALKEKKKFKKKSIV